MKRKNQFINSCIFHVLTTDLLHSKALAVVCLQYEMYPVNLIVIPVSLPATGKKTGTARC